MTVLKDIISNKFKEVEQAKKQTTIAMLEETRFYSRKVNSLVEALRDQNSTGIIAEFKRKSPSKGNINLIFQVEEVTKYYFSSGAAGLSVLTDFVFFGGTQEDLQIARETNPTAPILRKDFIIDEYQVYETKSWGADVILLIAAALSPEQIQLFSKLAHSLGLEVLLEVHNLQELENSPLSYVDIIGVNNRGLKIMSEKNVSPSYQLIKHIPNHILKISESLISEPSTVRDLKQVGFNGFLIGEAFMKTSNPGVALKNFLTDL